MIDRRKLPLNALRVFEAVAQCGGFRRGAESLSITQSAASRHVANLEAVIGRSLFDRTGRRLKLSIAGATLLPAVKQGFSGIEEVLNQLDANRSIRVHMPPAFLGPAAMELLKEFRQSHPAIAIEVVSSYETGTPQAGADIAITFDRASFDDRVTDLLRPIRFTVQCLDVLGPEQDETLEQFLNRSELLNVRIAGMSDDHLWSAFAEAVGIRLATRPSVTFATAADAADYARGGGGVMLGEYHGSEVGQGSGLTSPFDAIADLGYGYYLSMRPELLADPALTRLRKILISRFSAQF